MTGHPTLTLLLSLAANAVPTDLLPDVMISLQTPQVGPYHQEGPFMDSHLVGVFQALKDAKRGVFHPDMPTEFRSLLMTAATDCAELAPLHVLLHDLDKATTMTFVYSDGRKVAVSWDAWQDMLDGDEDGPAIRAMNGEALERFCARKEIVQISYYQNLPDSTVTHGRKTAERLGERGDLDQLLVDGIRLHEIAFQFGVERDGVDIPLYRKYFADYTDAEMGYFLLVNYADQLGSIKEGGRVDISRVVLLAKSWMASKSYDLLVQRLKVSLKKLDWHRLNPALNRYFDSPTAFQEETLIQAIGRFEREFALPEVSETDVREALDDVIDLPDELREAIVADMTTDGKLSSKTGRSLGWLNRSVRQALKGIGK